MANETNEEVTFVSVSCARFLLFVNHLPTYVVSKCKYFVDGLKIYLKVRHSNLVDMLSDLSSCQSDIDIIVHVASFWVLQLNHEKYCVLQVRSLLSKD